MRTILQGLNIGTAYRGLQSEGAKERATAGGRKLWMSLVIDGPRDHEVS